MTVALIILLVVVLIFGAVVAYGAPYLPTLKPQRQDAFKLLNLQPGQLFVDLGSGDGRMLSLAASQGLRAVGYELNPLLVIVARLYNFRYRRQVRVVWGNFWKADVSKANGVFVFLIARHMARFDKFMQAQNFNQPVRLVSYTFMIPGKKPVKKSGALFLYEY